MNDPLIGAMFANRYRIERMLARSSLSIVYQALDVTTQTPVAVKLMSGLMLTDPDSTKRFHREAQIARSLMHPNICALLDHGLSADGSPFQILEFIEGQTLDELIEKHGAVDPLDALSIFAKTCRAVQYLHSRGIIHRDLKPGNLMVPADSDPPSVKVIDFGVAKGTLKGHNQSVELTKPGEVFGSLLYTPPERVTGQKADARSDIYSMGCVMYETLTGANPFTGDTPEEIAANQLKTQPEPLVRFGLPPEIAALFQPIVDKALDKNPNKRFQTASQLKEALDEIEVPLKVLYAPNSTRRRALEDQHRGSLAWRRFVAIAAILAGIAGAIIIAFVAARELGIPMPWSH